MKETASVGRWTRLAIMTTIAGVLALGGVEQSFAHTSPLAAPGGPGPVPSGHKDAGPIPPPAHAPHKDAGPIPPPVVSPANVSHTDA